MAKILLVEDDDNWLQIEERYLRRLGYDVVLAKNSEEAISALDRDAGIDLVLSDLHMHGLNGDLILEDIILKNRRVRFGLVSGTIMEKDKADLATHIPFMQVYEKDDFVGREELKELLAENIAASLEEGIIDYSGKTRHAKFLTEFKLRPPPPRIRVETGRIKGRVFSMLERHGAELGNFADFLRDYNYFGDTDKETEISIHTLKNKLSGHADNNLAKKTPLYQEMRSIADDIMVVINTPHEEQIQLREAIDVAACKMGEIYGVELDIDVSRDIMITDPTLYVPAIRALIENACLEGVDTVRIYTQDDHLVIENQGTLPDGLVDATGHKVKGIGISTHSFGTGLGIDQAVDLLEQAESDLVYEVGGGNVRAMVNISGAQESGQPPEPSSTPKKVLVYDQKLNPRFSSIRAAYDEDQFPGIEMVFGSGMSSDSMLGVDLSGYDAIVIHPNAHSFYAMWQKAMVEHPDIQVIIVGRGFKEVDYRPETGGLFYMQYRTELARHDKDDLQILENATFLTETPSVESLRDLLA